MRHGSSDRRSVIGSVGGSVAGYEKFTKNAYLQLSIPWCFMRTTVSGEQISTFIRIAVSQINWAILRVFTIKILKDRI